MRWSELGTTVNLICSVGIQSLDDKVIGEVTSAPDRSMDIERFPFDRRFVGALVRVCWNCSKYPVDEEMESTSLSDHNIQYSTIFQKSHTTTKGINSTLHFPSFSRSITEHGLAFISHGEDHIVAWADSEWVVPGLRVFLSRRGASNSRVHMFFVACQHFSCLFVVVLGFVGCIELLWARSMQSIHRVPDIHHHYHTQ
eukprot:scaffold22677_cov139-Cylindrotheca_fusiformis.AAC.4